MDADVGARTGKARATSNMFKSIWGSKEIRTQTELRIINSSVKSVLFYVSMDRRLKRSTKTGKQTFQIFINSCLRRILYIGRPEKIRNEETLGDQILRRNWGWIGHSLRKAPTNITRQSLTWKPQGKRKKRAP